MKQTRLFHRLIALTLFLLFLLPPLVGCRPNPERPNPNNSKNNAPELPEVLEDLENTLLETMYTIDAVPGIEIAMMEMEKLKSEVETETEKKLEQKEKEQQAKQNINMHMFISQNATLIPMLREEDIENDLIAEMKDPPDDIEKIWFRIEDNINTIHRQWNILVTQLQKANVSRDTIDKFETYLNRFALSVLNKNTIESLIEMNELLNLLADSRSYFNTKIPSEVYKMKYHIRHCILLASIDEFLSALENINKTSELEKVIRQRLTEKGAEDIIQRFQLSLDSLEQQLLLENFTLSKIKGTIVMKNIQLMDKTFKGTQ